MDGITRYDRRRFVPLSASTRRQTLLVSLLHESWLWGVVIVTLDIAAWTICLYFNVALRDSSMHIALTRGLFLLGVWPLVAILTTLFVVGGYDRRTDMLSLTYMSEHMIGMGAAVFAASLLVYCFASYELPVKPGRGTLLLAFTVFTPLSLVFRRAIYARTRAEMAKKYFLVLGAGSVVATFLDAYKRSNNQQSLRLVDLASERADLRVDGTGELREDEVFAQLDSLSPENEGVIVAVPVNRLSETLRDRLVRLHFQQTPVYTLDAFYETYWRRIPVFALDPAWPLQMGFNLVRTSPYRHFKRLCDIVSATAGLILLSPLFGIITLLTIWDSGWPVIFRQERVGRGGESFTILKFRSMKNRAAGSEGSIYTQTNDPRITRVGKWLRKLRLDELPQLWNVLRGDMSLIGPRAEWVKCAERYEGTVPSYHFRHLVKPGITGWAQVNYSYGEGEEDALQKLKYDLYYIRRYSLRLDAMIALKTLHIIFWGKGQ